MDQKESKSGEKDLNRVPEKKKVTIFLRAVGGNTPILKRKKFKVKASNQFSSIISFLRKNLNCSTSDSVFLYCAQSFSPSPEEVIEDLFNCFQINNELAVYYCTTNCWG
mmetsp:Transcript_23150/g.32357  ORF Transcript_23150/g.32357 Transcript_23150/m.32357 type:complete len:109 (-) Transcript_23150:320-646(-)